MEINSNFFLNVLQMHFGGIGSFGTSPTCDPVKIPDEFQQQPPVHRSVVGEVVSQLSARKSPKAVLFPFHMAWMACKWGLLTTY